jgi:glutamate 5-kinase
MASWSGIRCVIGRASRPGILAGAVSDELIGTTFAPRDRALSARKLWIAFAADVSGSIQVDRGARRALVDRPNSLLPAGVVAVEGSFEPGDVVDVTDPDGLAFARGRVSVGAAGLSAVLGSQTSELPDGMVHEVIHRDDLVVLEPAGPAGERRHER